jgi:hypothetical protein
LRHHSAKDLSLLLGMAACRPKGDKILNHNSRANTHEVRRCWIVSSSWSQSGQWLGWGRPLLASRSAVQHLFWMASQRKTLHLDDAHDFHNLRHGSKVIDPLKKAL